MSHIFMGYMYGKTENGRKRMTMHDSFDGKSYNRSFKLQSYLEKFETRIPYNCKFSNSVLYIAVGLRSNDVDLKYIDDFFKKNKMNCNLNKMNCNLYRPISIQL